jgi:hypothetical protein
MRGGVLLSNWDAESKKATVEIEKRGVENKTGVVREVVFKTGELMSTR